MLVFSLDGRREKASFPIASRPRRRKSQIQVSNVGGRLKPSKIEIKTGEKSKPDT
jgi:hypothetical protein